MPPSTRQARKTASTSTPNCMPAPGRQSRKAAPPPAAQAECPLAPGRQARKTASTSTPNCKPSSTRPPISQSGTSTSAPNYMPPSTQAQTTCRPAPGRHQHPKLHAANLAKRHLHQQPKLDAPWHRQARKTASTSTPNCMPAPGRQSRKAAPPPAAQAGCPLAPVKLAQKASTSTPNCMPAPGRQSRKAAPPPAAQAGCPLAPVKLAKQHPPAPQTACQHPAVNLAKRHLHQQPKLDAP